jgi:hypothetical protein
MCVIKILYGKAVRFHDQSIPRSGVFKYSVMTNLRHKYTHVFKDRITCISTLSLDTFDVPITITTGNSNAQR